MKFECSKLLRSSQADHDYIFLLCMLSRNLSEPFWSRAQQQLQFRNSDFPLANVLVRLLILDDEMESQMMESQMRSWLKGFIVHHQVSFAHSLCIHRPCQWHELLIRTFLDDKVFTPCKATPVQTVQQIRNSVPEWIFRHYAWGLDFSAKLSTGYILPKPSRMFKKARPIINYSTSWPRKLGQAIGIALLEILNIVYSDLLKFQDVHAGLGQIRLIFQVIATDERTFEIHQSDIAGFYNQVEHDRILQAVDFALHRFFALQ